MSKYAAINEMLNRYNTGRLDLTDEEANLLAMQAQRLGKDFKVRSKPISKGFFDLADMATFGLVPDEWRPSSPGQEVFGESSADRFAGAIGSIGGLIGGVAGATKGAKMGWNALKKVFAKRKADNIATNIYKGNLLGPGPNVPQLGQGSPLPLPPGRPYQQGGYVQGYQEGGLNLDRYTLMRMGIEDPTSETRPREIRNKFYDLPYTPYGTTDVQRMQNVLKEDASTELVKSRGRAAMEEKTPKTTYFDESWEVVPGQRFPDEYSGRPGTYDVLGKNTILDVVKEAENRKKYYSYGSK